MTRDGRARTPEATLGRRAFLRGSLAGLGTLLAAGAGLGGVSCSDRASGPGPRRPAVVPEPPPGPLRRIRRVASPGEVEIGPGRVYRSWFYDGNFPGSEIRAREGEWLRITLDNDLPEPARMGRVRVEFVADNPGDWFFHCHNLYHLDSGMARVFRYVAR